MCDPHQAIESSSWENSRTPHPQRAVRCLLLFDQYGTSPSSTLGYLERKAPVSTGEPFSQPVDRRPYGDTFGYQGVEELAFKFQFKKAKSAARLFV